VKRRMVWEMKCPYCGRATVGINGTYCVNCGKMWPWTLLVELRRIEEENGWRPKAKKKRGRLKKKRGRRKR